MNTVFRLVNPVYDMDTQIFKLNVFTKQAEHEQNTVCFSRSAYSTCMVGTRVEVQLNPEPPSLTARYLEKKTRRYFDFFAPPSPFLFPRVPPRFTRRLIKTSAPDEKKIGLIQTFSRVYPKKREHAPGKQKNRRFHAKSTSCLFKVSCSQLYIYIYIYLSIYL